MFARIKQFVLRVRNSTDSVRKRWVVFCTIPVFGVILLFWIQYMRGSVSEGAPIGAQASQTGVFDVFGAGFEVVGERLKRGGERVKGFVVHELAGPTFSVSPVERNFQRDTKEEDTKPVQFP